MYPTPILSNKVSEYFTFRQQRHFTLISVNNLCLCQIKDFAQIKEATIEQNMDKDFVINWAWLRCYLRGKIGLTALVDYVNLR